MLTLFLCTSMSRCQRIRQRSGAAGTDYGADVKMPPARRGNADGHGAYDCEGLGSRMPDHGQALCAKLRTH